MAAPNLGIQVQPMEGGKATYLPLAPTTSNGTVGLKIVLRLRLANQGSTMLRVTKIRFSFPGSSQPAMDMQGVNLDGSLDLAGGANAFWSNGRVDLDLDPDAENWINNSVYLTGSAPSQVKIDVTCKDFSEPATLTLNLAAHQSPVPEKAYRFPYAAGELRSDEYYSASAVHWANGGPPGTQIFAHDIGIVGWNNGEWSSLLPGGSKMKNEDYRIWNKPIRAVADGTVDDWSDGLDDNTITADSNGSLLFPTPAVMPRAGNNIIIKHGTEVVQSCHFKAGSMAPELKQKGVVVAEGQYLGRAGNTGNATNPHTHLECRRASDDALRPLPFRSASVIDRTKLSPPSDAGPWFKLHGHGIGKDTVAIWPASTAPGFPIPAAGISMQGDWGNTFWISPDVNSFAQKAQDLFDDQGRRLMRATTFLESGKRRWLGIARDGNWASRWWTSPDLNSFTHHAQELFDQNGLRLIYVDTFVDGGQRTWIGIAQGGTWANRLIIKDTLASFSSEAQSLFDNDGLRLTYVTTWLEGSQRRWFGIARSGTWANRWWISPNLGEFSSTAQKLFDEEDKRLIHVTTYAESGQRRWIGIARSGSWANRWYYRADLDSFGLEAQRLFDDDGLRLVHVDTLE